MDTCLKEKKVSTQLTTSEAALSEIPCHKYAQNTPQEMNEYFNWQHSRDSLHRGNQQGYDRPHPS